MKKCTNLNKTIILKNNQLKSYLATPSFNKAIKLSQYHKIKNNKANQKVKKSNKTQYEYMSMMGIIIYNKINFIDWLSWLNQSKFINCLYVLFLILQLKINL